MDKSFQIVSIILILCVLSIVGHVVITHRPESNLGKGEPVVASQSAYSNSDLSEGNASVIRQGTKEVDPMDLRNTALSNKSPWSSAFRAKVMSLSPAELLAFLDNDELLLIDDARSMIEDIYGVCGVVLGLMNIQEENYSSVSQQSQTLDIEHLNLLSNPGSQWCFRMSENSTADQTRSRLNELLEVAITVDPSGSPRRVRARDDVATASDLGKPELLRQLQSDDAMTVFFAALSLLENRDTNFIEDWTPIEVLSPTQSDLVLEALFVGLDCRFVGNCSLDNYMVSGLCLLSGFQCGGQSALDGILYQSFSPAQFAAYDLLLTSVLRHRRSERRRS